MQQQTTCTRCGGSGKVVKNACPTCRGKGKVRKNKKISVKIPAGVDNGQAVRVAGEGSVGTGGGPKGDLLVEVNVLPHSLFERDGSDVLCEIPITFVQAALGGELEVPTLDGKVRYNIPEGTQTGTTFRLRGKGIPVVGYQNRRGDQYVTVTIETPKNLNKEQKELLHPEEVHLRRVRRPSPEEEVRLHRVRRPAPEEVRLHRGQVRVRDRRGRRRCP